MRSPLLSILTGLSGLSGAIALSGWAIAPAQAEPAQPMLIAQQIVDGLPPPPSIPPSMALPPVSPATTVTPAPQTGIAPVQSTRPTLQTGVASVGERYAVFVNGDSPLLLEQVRKVESGAFLQDREGRRVIQAGIFSDSSRATQQAAALEAEGIGAEVVSVQGSPLPTLQAANAPASSYMQLPPPTFNDAPATTPVQPSASFSTPVQPPNLVPVEQAPREIIFGQPTESSQRGVPAIAYNTSGSGLPDEAYYVVIPGRSQELRDISVRVTQLAGGLSVSENSIVERESPLGPHVIVGPFIDRGTASRWDRYFRAFGLSDSRVYYRR